MEDPWNLSLEKAQACLEKTGDFPWNAKQARHQILPVLRTEAASASSWQRAASRPWQAWAICPRGSSRLQAGSGGEPWTTCWGAGGRPWGQLRGGVGEKIGETAAKPGTPQLPRTIQRCCPNISRSLQITFAWLTVRVLDNVAVQTPWEAERYTIIGNDWQPRGSLT